jgi:hypothetical protein
VRGADLDDKLSAYARQAAEWNRLVGTNPKAANRIFDTLHRAAVDIRASEEGRSGLRALLEHDDVGVRLLAASESLPFAQKAAEAVLEKLSAEGGLAGFSAAQTLNANRAGTLDMNW